MFYEPKTNLVFESIQEFQLHYKHTSFGDLSTEEERNKIGLFKVTKTNVTFDEDLSIKELDSIEFVDNKYQTKWRIVPKQLSEQELQQIIIAKNNKLKQSIIEETQIRLDTFAQSRGYDGILSACTYATSSVQKFRSEGQYCVDVRDSTWSALYEHLKNVEAGTVTVPTGFSDVESLLPTLQWPV